MATQEKLRLIAMQEIEKDRNAFREGKRYKVLYSGNKIVYYTKEPKVTSQTIQIFDLRTMFKVKK